MRYCTFYEIVRVLHDKGVALLTSSAIARLAHAAVGWGDCHAVRPQSVVLLYASNLRRVIFYPPVRLISDFAIIEANGSLTGRQLYN